MISISAVVVVVVVVIVVTGGGKVEQIGTVKRAISDTRTDLQSSLRVCFLMRLTETLRTGVFTNDDLHYNSTDDSIDCCTMIGQTLPCHRPQMTHTISPLSQILVEVNN